jgi:hypothetical protein
MSRKIITFVLTGLLLLTVAAASPATRPSTSGVLLGSFFYFFPGVVLAAPDRRPSANSPIRPTNVAAQAGPKVCYVRRCHLQGDSVDGRWQWVWVSNRRLCPWSVG